VSGLVLNLDNQFLSMTQYAKLKNITRQGVHKAIKTGRLQAEKVGNCWIISKYALIRRRKNERNVSN
jgi:predicted DNA-binding protein YlxM (UPF0122 family)